MSGDPLRQADGMIKDKYRIECSVSGLKVLAGLYGFKIHGDTATEIDLEFGNIYRAASFVQSFEDHGWSMRLREPVTDFTSPVTVIVTKYVHWNGRTYGQLSAEERRTVTCQAAEQLGAEMDVTIKVMEM